MSRLKVFAIGTSIVEPGMEVGVEVLVDPNALTKSLIIPKEGFDVLLVSIFDIVEIL